MSETRNVDAWGESEPEKTLSGQLRGLVSLALFLHLFCLVVVLSSNQFASNLQLRLIETISPYTRLLFFDPQLIVGFHLTHAMEFEDDHLLEVRLDEGQTVYRYPDPEQRTTGWRGGFRYQRWCALARRVAMNVNSENDEYLAELARAMGQHHFSDDGENRMQFRVLRRRPLQLTAETVADEGGPDAYEIVYAADIRRDDQGTVRVIKQVDVGEAAPVDDQT